VASEVIEEWERKAHARARRARALSDPFDTRTRVVPSQSQYRRGFKHIPRTVEDWDLLD
jgi:hypothetical protein